MNPRRCTNNLKVVTDLLTQTEIISRSRNFTVADKVYVEKGTPANGLFHRRRRFTGRFGFCPERLLVLAPYNLPNRPGPNSLRIEKVWRYSFTEHDLADPNIIFERAEGDLWLAQPDNYLAQYVISATLRIVIPDPKVHFLTRAYLNLRYTPDRHQRRLTIAPPVEAFAESEALSRLPRLPDAQIVSVFPTFIEYTSAITPVAAALFYRDKLTIQGWTENQADIFNEKARLIYSKNDEALTVLINPADERNKIKVLLDLK